MCTPFTTRTRRRDAGVDASSSQSDAQTRRKTRFDLAWIPDGFRTIVRGAVEGEPGRGPSDLGAISAVSRVREARRDDPTVQLF